MKWGVPAYQRTSSFHKYTRARTRIYFRKLLVRWYAGTLVHFSLFIPSPRTPLYLPKTIPFWGGVDMPSTRGRPAIDPRETREKHPRG